MRRSDPTQAPIEGSGRIVLPIRTLILSIACVAATIFSEAVEPPPNVYASEPADVQLYSRFVQWQASPGTRVEASLLRRGREHASAVATADADGTVEINFVGGGGAPIRGSPV